MKLRNLLLATASLALALGMAGAVLAQSSGPAPGGRTRHLLFIAPPGGGGGDDQSGIVVLDADHDYRFIKRISYGLPAARLPGPEISGMSASVPENKVFVTTDGRDMLAFDLNTDKIAWDFKGEKAPVATTRGGAATNGCC